MKYPKLGYFFYFAINNYVKFNKIQNNSKTYLQIQNKRL